MWSKLLKVARFNSYLMIVFKGIYKVVGTLYHGVVMLGSCSYILNVYEGGKSEHQSSPN